MVRRGVGSCGSYGGGDGIYCVGVLVVVVVMVVLVTVWFGRDGSVVQAVESPLVKDVPGRSSHQAAGGVRTGRGGGGDSREGRSLPG